MRIHLSRFDIAACAVLVAVPYPSWATQDDVEASFLEHLPIVLSVSRMPTALHDAPGAVSIIDQEMIRATGYRSLGRLFRLVPGMQVAQERGNDQWVTYHGLGPEFPNQMQVLIDGRSVYSPAFFGGPNWGAIPIDLADIERIEVIRGSDSATYGSNAFLGVVNVITRHTANEPGSSARVRLGEGRTRDISARAVSRSGPLGVRLSAVHMQDDGFSGLHDGSRKNALNLRSDLRLGPTDELSLFTGVSTGRNEHGYPGTPFNSNAVRESHVQDGFFHLRWNHTPDVDEAISLAWYHNRERTREAWEAHAINLGLNSVPVNQHRSSRRDNLEFLHRFAPGDDLRVSWGAELRRDVLDAPVLFFGKGTQRERLMRIFGNFEWRMADHWLLNAGVMAERFDSEPTRLSPRLFINWQPQRTQSWRAGYSRAYRQPSLFEQNADVRIFAPGTGELLHQRHLANPQIRAQRIDAFELGYLGKLPGTRATADVRVFRERISDLIWRQQIDIDTPPAAASGFVIDPVPGTDHDIIQRALGATRWHNLSGRVTLTGVEYQLKVSPWKDGNLILNHAMIRASARNQRHVERSVAPYVASLSWQQRFGPWQSMLSVLRMGPIDAGSGFVPDYRYTVPAYTTLDWSVARTTKWHGVPVELRLTGLNLLGKHQELAHRPLQHAAGTRPVNRVEPKFYLTLTTGF